MKPDGLLIREDFFDLTTSWGMELKAIIAVGYFVGHDVEELTPSTLARFCGFSKPMAVRFIRFLEDDGWIETYHYIPDRCFSGKLICEQCGLRCGYLREHHITFRSKGGSDNPENLINLCPNCHAKAHSLHFRVTDKFKTYIKLDLKEE